MFHEEIDDSYIVTQIGTSEGTQVKYRKDGFWYKKDNRGHEGRAEYLVSKFLEYTSLNENEYVKYEEGMINGKAGCRSRNFLRKDEEFRPAPIFDNGVSLLTANQSVNWHFPIEENVKRVVARPFSGSHEKMVEYIGRGFTVDVTGALAWLEYENKSIERDILIHQIKRYANLLGEENML